MEDKINRIFDKLENADVSPSSNYSMPEYYMHCAMRGSEKEKRTLFNWISMFTGIDVDTISNIFNERYNNVQNESRNMRRTIRLRESELKQIVKESVNKVLTEAYGNEDPSDIQNKLIDYCLPMFTKVLKKYPNIEVETDNDSIFAYDDSGYGITVKFEYTMF